MLNRRRELIAQASQGSGDLPSGYTRLNYIQNSSGQWIDLNYVLQSETVEVEGIVKHSGGRGSSVVVSKYPRPSGVGVFAIENRAYNGNITFILGSTTVTLNSASTDIRSFKLTTENKNYTIIENNDLWNGTYTGNFAGNYLQSFTSGDGDYVLVQLYALSIKDNGIQVRNLIPALDPNNRPCMFDTVSQTPFYNAGTGEFLYG